MHAYIHSFIHAYMHKMLCTCIDDECFVCLWAYHTHTRTRPSRDIERETRLSHAPTQLTHTHGAALHCTHKHKYKHKQTCGAPSGRTTTTTTTTAPPPPPPPPASPRPPRSTISSASRLVCVYVAYFSFCVSMCVGGGFF